MSIIKKESMERLAAMLRQAELNASGNTDDQALKVPNLYPNLEDIPDGTYVKKGRRVRYKDVLYNVITGHVRQKGQTPDNTTSLFAKVLGDPDEITVWEQPESTNGYGKGIKVTHKWKVWESMIDNNVWEPGVQGTEELWVEVKE